jgi:hypothetical protein
MARKAKKWNQKSRITSALRRIWFYGPQRKEKVKQLKLNNNKCETCNISHVKLEVDHIAPVVPLKGFDNWQNYIDRLFVEPKGLRGLCKSCHLGISTIQREQRKKYKKVK